MKCEACERGDHDNCAMRTWCDCDCEGCASGSYLPPGYAFIDDLDGGRLVKKDETPTAIVPASDLIRELPAEAYAREIAGVDAEAERIAAERLRQAGVGA